MLPLEFNYRSNDWSVLKVYLNKRLETAVGQLCNPSCGPTEADQLRGKISFIKEMLAGESAAQRDRLQGGNLNE